MNVWALVVVLVFPSGAETTTTLREDLTLSECRTLVQELIQMDSIRDLKKKYNLESLTYHCKLEGGKGSTQLKGST